jgi:hypothetical protein
VEHLAAKKRSQCCLQVLEAQAVTNLRDRGHLAMFVQSQKRYGSSNLKTGFGRLREAEK